MMWCTRTRFPMKVFGGFVAATFLLLYIQSYIIDTRISFALQNAAVSLPILGDHDVISRAIAMENGSSATPQQRLAKIQSFCSFMDIPGQVDVVYMYKNVSYCANHKVASTYWLQIFRYLHHDTVRPVRLPSEISKFETHLTALRKREKRAFLNPRDYRAIMDSYRFMMTRDPYERLWSVYVDKFVLVDNWFWTNYGPEIRETYLKGYNPRLFNSASNLRLRQKYKNTCLQISFEEFLFYVAVVGSHTASRLDDHVRPVHYGCNPCKYKPDFVGRVETLNRDKTPLLVKLGLEDVDEVHSYEDHVRNEIHTLSEFGFKMQSIMSRGRCVSKMEVEERLIKGFVLNGYLPDDTLQRVRHLMPIGGKNFTNTLMDIFNQSGRSHAEVSTQRRLMRMEAYKPVPSQILSQLQKIYEYDFLLFGYDPAPKDIFGNGSDFKVNMSDMTR